MAVGDWAVGTTGQLSAGAQTNLTPTGELEIQANWFVNQPSGRKAWPGLPGGQPFVYTTTDMTITLTAATVAVAQALANAEGITFVLADGTQVPPT